MKEGRPRGVESLPTTSEGDLISVIAVYCHGMPGTGLSFRKQEGLERWYSLINKASLIVGMAVSQRTVDGLSMWLISPQEGLWCHLTHYHPGHELAGLTRACQALCRHALTISYVR